MAKKSRRQIAAESAVVRRPETKMYYLLDPNIETAELGGVSINRDGDDPFVMMNEKQAQFFVDQGAIGLDSPKTKRGSDAALQAIGYGDETITKGKETGKPKSR